MIRAVTTREQFAAGVLRQGGWLDQPAQVEALVCGMALEDSHATWNPLDTTEPWEGATDYNSIGVRNYPDETAGILATVATLRLDYYTGVRAALANPRATSYDILTAFGDSPWGGVGNFAWRDLLVSPGWDYATASAVEVAGSAPVPVPPPAPAPAPGPVPPVPVPAPLPGDTTYCNPSLPVLNPGDVGYPVRVLQRLISPQLTEDGVYGPATLEAVKAWQAGKPELTPNGVIGPKSWEALIGRTLSPLGK